MQRHTSKSSPRRPGTAPSAQAPSRRGAPRPVKWASPFLAALVILASCSGRSLDGKGRVRLWTTDSDASLDSAASSISGLSLEKVSGDLNAQLLAAPGKAPDLIFSEFAPELKNAVSKQKLLDLDAYWERLPSARGYWQGFSSKPFVDAFGGRFFLPSKAYLWGLWYNKNALEKAGIAPPSSFEELEKAFNALKAREVIPLTLGAASGWPALALVNLLDLRRNGPAAYAKSLKGSRGLGDPSMLSVYATLAKWKNQAWIDPDAAGTGWEEALAKLEKGQAAFLFMSAYAVRSVKAQDSVGFIGFPFMAGSRERAELAVIEGFSVMASSGAPEAALSLADASIKEASKEGEGDGFSISALRPPKNRNRSDSGSVGIPDIQRNLLEAADAVLPQMDRFLPVLAVNGVLRTLRTFLSPGTSMDPIDLSKALGTAQSIQ